MGSDPGPDKTAVEKRLRLEEELARFSPHAQRLRAVQLAYDREVECRFVPEGGPESHRELFLAELEDLLDLDHEAFPTVLEGGSSRGRPYYLVPLRDHVPLARTAKSPDFEVAERCRVVRALASAMAAAHRTGIALGAPSPITLAWDRARGRLCYVHHRFPEQVARLPLPERATSELKPDAAPSPHADVFHWANLAYWLLSKGKFPYSGKAPQVRIHKVVPELSPDLAQVVDAALALEPGARPANLLEVEAVLVSRPTDLLSGPEEAVDRSGVHSAALIQQSVTELKVAGRVEAPPPRRRARRPVLPEEDLALPVDPFRLARRLAPVALGTCVLAGALLVFGGGSGPEEISADRPVDLPGSPASPSRNLADMVKDPYVQLLIRRTRVDARDFSRIHGLMSRLAHQGRLPTGLGAADRLKALQDQSATDLPAAVKGLEALLADLRAELGQG